MDWYRDYLSYLLKRSISDLLVSIELERYLQSHCDAADLAKHFRENEMYKIRPGHHVQAMMALQSKMLETFGDLVSESHSIPNRQHRIISEKAELEAQLTANTATMETLKSKKGSDPESVDPEEIEKLRNTLKMNQSTLTALQKEYDENASKLERAAKLKDLFRQRTSRNFLGCDRNGSYYWAILTTKDTELEVMEKRILGIIVEADLLKPPIERTYRYVKDLKEIHSLLEALDAKLECEANLLTRLRQLHTYLEKSMPLDQVHARLKEFPEWVDSLISHRNEDTPDPCKYDQHYGSMLLESLFELAFYCNVTPAMKETLRGMVGQSVEKFVQQLIEWIDGKRWFRITPTKANALEHCKNFASLGNWIKSNLMSAKSQYKNDMEANRLAQEQSIRQRETRVVPGRELRATVRDKEESSDTSSRVASRLRRGSVDVHVSYQVQDSSDDGMSVDESVTSNSSAPSEVEELVESDDLMDYPSQSSQNARWPSQHSDVASDHSVSDHSDSDDSNRIQWVDEIPPNRAYVLIDNSSFPFAMASRRLAELLFPENSSNEVATSSPSIPSSASGSSQAIPSIQKVKSDTATVLKGKRVPQTKSSISKNREKLQTRKRHELNFSSSPEMDFRNIRFDSDDEIDVRPISKKSNLRILSSSQDSLVPTQSTAVPTIPSPRKGLAPVRNAVGSVKAPSKPPPVLSTAGPKKDPSKSSFDPKLAATLFGSEEEDHMQPVQHVETNISRGKDIPPIPKNRIPSGGQWSAKQLQRMSEPDLHELFGSEDDIEEVATKEELFSSSKGLSSNNNKAHPIVLLTDSSSEEFKASAVSKPQKITKKKKASESNLATSSRKGLPIQIPRRTPMQTARSKKLTAARVSGLRKDPTQKPRTLKKLEFQSIQENPPNSRFILDSDSDPSLSPSVSPEL
jgi:hypothetical protein